MDSIAELMKQAQTMQKRMQEIQGELGSFKVVGQSGAGQVKIILNGTHAAERAFVDPGLEIFNIPMNDANGEKTEAFLNAKAVLEDLIVAAINDATRKIEEESRNKMMELAQGIQLPPEFQVPFDGEDGQ
jgi:DNA-binding YbaB/EbfC family protein